MLTKKKLLLSSAKNTAEYIRKNGGGNFAGFILNIIRRIDKQQLENEQKPQQLWHVLFNIKNANIDLIGGGKSIKQSYVNFVDDYLKIRRVHNEYRPGNKDFDNFNLDEINYVFAWVKRLVKDEDSRKSEQRPDKNVKNMHPIRNKTRYGGAKNKNGFEPFNTQISEQLRNLKIDNNK